MKITCCDTFWSSNVSVTEIVNVMNFPAVTVLEHLY